MTFPAGLELEEALGLPLEHLVGHALEGLAEHDEPLAVPGAEVDVRQLPLAAAAAPLDGEHHQVERVHGLDLAPRAAAPAGIALGLAGITAGGLWFFGRRRDW